MSFKQGERIHTHSGKTYRVGKGGKLPEMKRGRTEISAIRGFVRGALVDCLTGEERPGDWHENTITTYGHNMVVRNYIGVVSSDASVMATNTTQMGWARFWAIGYMTNTGANSTNYSSMSAIDSTEYGLHSTGGSSRATVSVGSQLLSGTWSLSQSFQYASTHISDARTVNCIAQYHTSSCGAGTAHSLATFASSTKGTTQALNVTYNWVFST